MSLFVRSRPEDDEGADDLILALVKIVRPIVEAVVEQAFVEHDQERRWLTAVEAGELLGISPAAVGARVRKGTLPGRLYCRRIYVDRTALDAAIDGSATLPTSAWGDPRATRRPRR